MRFHTHLPILDLERTEAFYRALLGAGPVKRKPDYLKFLTPELNLAFTLAPEAKPPTFIHLGFEVPNQAELDALHARLEAAGLISEARDRSVCCYAAQDKFWVTDPNGYRWELYRLLEDTEQRDTLENRCCSPLVEPVPARQSPP